MNAQGFEVTRVHGLEIFTCAREGSCDAGQSLWGKSQAWAGEAADGPHLLTPSHQSRTPRGLRFETKAGLPGHYEGIFVKIGGCSTYI